MGVVVTGAAGRKRREAGRTGVSAVLQRGSGREVVIEGQMEIEGSVIGEDGRGLWRRGVGEVGRCVTTWMGLGVGGTRGRVREGSQESGGMAIGGGETPHMTGEGKGGVVRGVAWVHGAHTSNYKSCARRRWSIQCIRGLLDK
jgi:hypothetical protein